MAARIRLTYTIEVDLGIEDYQLSEDEIAEKAEKVANENLPDNWVDWDLNWEDEPKSKGSSAEPPEDFYVDTPFGRAATNGHCLILEASPVKCKTERDWIDGPKKGLILDKVLEEYKPDLPLHAGWFDNVFLPFKEMQGLEVRGEGPLKNAYLVLNGELIGVIMPVDYNRRHPESREKCFQFNEEA